jgi:hypothetical protein
MPLGIKSDAAASLYASPFIGPVNHTVNLRVDISTLTTDEVDADGYLKPGVPLTKGGTRVGVAAAAGTAVAAAYAGNTGNGTMGAVTVSAGAKAGVYQLVIIEPAANAGRFTVEDPDGIIIGVGTVGVAFSAGGLAFTLADGVTDFVSGDGFTITVTLTAGGAATKYVYGVTVEAAKLPLVTIPPTNTSLGNETGDCDVAAATHGIVNLDIMEDNLARALTAAELAGFTMPGCHLALTNT